MTLELIQTSALLLALSLLQGLCLRFLSHRPRLAEIASGLVFGGVCVIGMMIPITLAPGVIIDGRSVVLSMAGLFGGPLAGVITGAIAGIYRVTLGGDGMIIGTISIALGVAFGLLYRAAWRGRKLSRRPCVSSPSAWQCMAFRSCWSASCPDRALPACSNAWACPTC
ncbi:LytS/YhcK type 5TM receptor domain-containing protein [Thauera humireducens]|uniref:LytS/YhcK type 5TM receptor domain-containing protein n=1 Tax=Thauera humireducens TaxID=1134435 RepID=UPI00311D6C44